MGDAKANGPNLNGCYFINTKGGVAGEVVIRQVYIGDSLRFESVLSFFAQLAILEAVRAQYNSEAAELSGLKELLLSTEDRLVACVDQNPFLGIQAAGGISTGQNQLGKALMLVRSELRAAPDA